MASVADERNVSVDY